MTPGPTSAPLNDLELQKSIVKYSEVHDSISTAATKTLSRHLWYLCEELVSLTFFNTATDPDIKRKIVIALQNPGPYEPPKHIQLKPTKMTNVDSKWLGDFITADTQIL